MEGAFTSGVSLSMVPAVESPWVLVAAVLAAALVFEEEGAGLFPPASPIDDPVFEEEGAGLFLSASPIDDPVSPRPPVPSTELEVDTYMYIT